MSAESGLEGKTGEPRRPIVAGPSAGRVVFVREEHRDDFGATMTFRIHAAPSAEAAKAFLQDADIHKQLLHIVVETPEGNFGRDIQGIYQE